MKSTLSDISTPENVCTCPCGKRAVINTPNVSWYVILNTPLMLLGKSNYELYLTFREEGPGRELTSTTKATRIRKPVGEPGAWLVSVCSWNFSDTNPFICVPWGCVLLRGSEMPGNGHPRSPSTSTSWSPWVTSYVIRLLEQSANSGIALRHEGRKG